MPYHIAVIFVHGIFAQDINFAEPMRNRLLKLLPNDLRRFVTFRSIFWASSVRDHQRDFMDRVRTNVQDITDNRWRRYLIEGLGDAAAYQKTRHREHSIYFKVQNSVTEKLIELDMPGHERRPLIFVGHSLGSHIISSFAWDLNKLKQRTETDIRSETDEDVKNLWRQLQPPHATPFRRLDTFAGFVTLGSNMPLFTFPFGPEYVFPISSAPKAPKDLKPAFPGADLPSSVRERARWLNFFSKRDLLGFPLKPLYEPHSETPYLQDVCVRTESLISRAVPYLSYYSAHSRYWTNPTVLEMTSKLIRDIIEAN